MCVDTFVRPISALLFLQPMIFAEAIQMPHFSLGIFLTLVVCLIASLGMFVVLLRRWITFRFRYELEQWAGHHRFKIAENPSGESLPAPLNGPEGNGLSARWIFTSEDRAIAQVILAPSAAEVRVYNICIAATAVKTPPVALKPAIVPQTILDRFRLAPAASTSSDRFQILGNDLSANLRISESIIAGIAPPDVAFLFTGGLMVIDFSSRPFDPIEFDRMLVLADQIGKVQW